MEPLEREIDNRREMALKCPVGLCGLIVIMQINYVSTASDVIVLGPGARGSFPKTITILKQNTTTKDWGWRIYFV